MLLTRKKASSIVVKNNYSDHHIKHHYAVFACLHHYTLIPVIIRFEEYAKIYFDQFNRNQLSKIIPFL